MIYLIEDDRDIRELVQYTLEATGLKCTGCADGESFFRVLDKGQAELILLDVMLPGEDGIAIARRLRADPMMMAVPIIMVSAKGTEFDKIRGLDAGADDYIAKPFGMMELLARVRANLRRRSAVENAADTPLCSGSIEMRAASHTVTVDGQAVLLTFKEFELLYTLMKNQGVVMSRQKLLESVWGIDSEIETRTVDVHVGTLRQKLGNAGEQIETVRGVGYRIAG